MFRTVSNRRRCTFPGCTRANELHDVPHFLRSKALKYRVYIPKRSRACAQHMSEDTWNTVQGNNRRSKFTANQINEMIELFCNSFSSNASNFLGEISMHYI